MFTWRLLSIGVSITSGFNLTCLPQLTGVPAPQPLILSKTTTSANVTGLYAGVSYICSIITLTTEGPSVPQNTTLTTPEKGSIILHTTVSLCTYSSPIAPSGAPVMFDADPGVRAVLLSWSPLPITQQNGRLTSYAISCSPSTPSLPQTFPHPAELPVTVTRFSPNTAYTCSVAAVNSAGSGPSKDVTFRTKEDC